MKKVYIVLLIFVSYLTAYSQFLNEEGWTTYEGKIG